MKVQISPIVRVSFGLLMLTLSLLLLGDWLGLIPSANKLELESRKRLSQNLAVQLSSLAMSGERVHIRTTLEALVEHDDLVVSAAFKSINGDTEFIAGLRRDQWQSHKDAPVSGDIVSVPIFRGEEPWGSVDVVFKQYEQAWLPGFYDNSFLKLLLFMTVSGFVLYLFFLRRTLSQLDPRKVIPHRVRAAFDSLAEGVLILDEDNNVVLANRVFARHAEVEADSLVGRPAESFGWSNDTGDPVSADMLPWNGVVTGGEAVTGGRLTLFAGAEAQLNLAVNCTPIHDDKQDVRGVIATFDDLTELERKNSRLRETLSELTKSKLAVDQKSKELEFLATRDPLTGCLNRRAFNDEYKQLIYDARQQDKKFVCMMIDIDHFKKVNDNYGHSMGDKVIKFMAETIAQNIRKGDLLARFGGEEFCVILFDNGIDEARRIAERMRVLVKAGDPSRFTASLRITASFGLAEFDESGEDDANLINRADKALYGAKNSGRDRVVTWGSPEASDSGLVDDVEEFEALAAIVAAAGDRVSEQPVIEPMKNRIRELESIAQEKAQQLDHFFTYDSLTNLPARGLFADRLEQALLAARRKQCVAGVMSLGLDDLSRINATLGYEYAEEMLRETAKRLSAVLRATDSVSLFTDDTEEATLSRLNEGEFGILLGAVKDSESLTWIVKRIFDALHEPFFVRQHSLSIASHIGIAVYPADGDDAMTLIKKASISRFHAEQQPGRNNVEFYSDDINRTSKEQLHIESELAEAIERKEFVVHYQPQIDLRSGNVSGFEALVRWDHPTRGTLAPIAFIDIAEQSRLINAIGEWVLRESCEKLREFEQHSTQAPTMAVNISPVQLSQPNLVERIMTILEETGVEPERLELELTETCLMENLDTALESLKKLNAAGIRISIDDFGTGYSALSYLRTLPIDTLKVDRAFVNDIDKNSDDHAIIAAIISMSGALGLSVVAEGVETQEQLQALMAMDCDSAQGYYFSRPVPAEQAIAYLQQQSDQQGDVPILSQA